MERGNPTILRIFLGALMLLATEDVNGKRALGAGNYREIDHESLVWEEKLRI